MYKCPKFPQAGVNVDQYFDKWDLGAYNQGVGLKHHPYLCTLLKLHLIKIQVNIITNGHRVAGWIVMMESN